MDVPISSPYQSEDLLVLEKLHGPTAIFFPEQSQVFRDVTAYILHAQPLFLKTREHLTTAAYGEHKGSEFIYRLNSPLITVVLLPSADDLEGFRCFLIKIHIRRRKPHGLKPVVQLIFSSCWDAFPRCVKSIAKKLDAFDQGTADGLVFINLKTKLLQPGFYLNKQLMKLLLVLP